MGSYQSCLQTLVCTDLVQRAGIENTEYIENTGNLKTVSVLKILRTQSGAKSDGKISFTSLLAGGAAGIKEGQRMRMQTELGCEEA